MPDLFPDSDSNPRLLQHLERFRVFPRLHLQKFRLGDDHKRPAEVGLGLVGPDQDVQVRRLSESSSAVGEIQDLPRNSRLKLLLSQRKQTFCLPI